MTLLLFLFIATSSAPQVQTPQAKPSPLIEEAGKLNAAGKPDEALALYRKVLAADPASFDAHLGAGIVLDLTGDLGTARTHLSRAIEVASEDQLNRALSAMAVSFAFECNTTESARFYQRVFDRQNTAAAFDQVAGTANALGRVYLECGDLANAQKWYETGRQASSKIEKLPEDQADLWAMRWHHAASRLAIRRGDKVTARREMDALRTLIDKNPENAKQMPIYHYLAGYVALYSGDPDTAAGELAKGDQEDAFILGLLAQAHEKRGDTTKAAEYWRKVLAVTTHNINNAFMRPQARKRLETK